ncbi:UV DNA damage repair endonuclease UvsE [Metabacillus sp. 113a]|uniref:UV DNA damage repair endonuclease UvsE n=1 Tax=Metabacillus sp. 113a TaxID=3404706 RepID=UPI003CEA1F53
MYIRLGYAAMSSELHNASPSKTMTYAQFSRLKNREAALLKLERIALENIRNCLRLLKHNAWSEIHFFRFSSRLVPLANHPELKDWDFMKPLLPEFAEVSRFLSKHPMRTDFHPDHFVLLNSSKPEILKNALQTLKMHRDMLKAMGINEEHRCVLHTGGAHKDKDKALEQFIHNWGFVPHSLQKLIMLENDDSAFHAKDVLYLCEKLGIPFVFDYHHHLAHHESPEWEEDWLRGLETWKRSSLPVKMHISSPRSEKEFRAHSDFVDPQMFADFLNGVKGSASHIDCMVEAKQKDGALFRLMEDLKSESSFEKVDGSSFYWK